MAPMAHGTKVRQTEKGERKRRGVNQQLMLTNLPTRDANCKPLPLTWYLTWHLALLYSVKLLDACNFLLFQVTPFHVSSVISTFNLHSSCSISHLYPRLLASYKRAKKKTVKSR